MTAHDGRQRERSTLHLYGSVALAPEFRMLVCPGVFPARPLDCKQRLMSFVDFIRQESSR